MGSNRYKFLGRDSQLAMHYRGGLSGIGHYMPSPERDWCRNEGCIRQVSLKVAKFSKEHYGTVLCWDCQRLDEWERNIVSDEENEGGVINNE